MSDGINLLRLYNNVTSERFTMKGNNNFKEVSVRKDRICWHCGNIIPVGTSCITINPKFDGRHWLCNSCYGVYKSILEAKGSLDAVPFDDEGAAYANADWLNDVVSEWEGRQCGADTALDLYVTSLIE